MSDKKPDCDPKYWTRYPSSSVDEALEKAYFNCEEGSYAWTLAAEVVHLRAESANDKAAKEHAVYRNHDWSVGCDSCCALLPATPPEKKQ